MGDGSALRTIKYDSKWLKGKQTPLHRSQSVVLLLLGGTRVDLPPSLIRTAALHGVCVCVLGCQSSILEWYTALPPCQAPWGYGLFSPRQSRSPLVIYSLAQIPEIFNMHSGGDGAEIHFNSLPLCLSVSPSEPHFLQAAEYGNYVYFFYREIAVEHSNLGKVRDRALVVPNLSHIPPRLSMQAFYLNQKKGLHVPRHMHLCHKWPQKQRGPFRRQYSHIRIQETFSTACICWEYSANVIPLHSGKICVRDTADCLLRALGCSVFEANSRFERGSSLSWSGRAAGSQHPPSATG